MGNENSSLSNQPGTKQTAAATLATTQQQRQQNDSSSTPYTISSVSKPDKSSKKNKNRLRQKTTNTSSAFTKSKLLSTLGQLTGASGSQEDVSEIYYVHSKSNTAAATDSSASDSNRNNMANISELERIKQEIHAMPRILPLMSREGDNTGGASLNKMIRKTLQNVLKTSQDANHAAVEEMSPKVLTDIFADFQTKALVAYKELLMRQHHIGYLSSKERLQIRPISNAKLKQTDVWFRDFTLLKNDLRKANTDLRRTMEMISELGHLLPANVKENIDDEVFEVFNDSTMEEMRQEAEKEKLRYRRQRQGTEGSPSSTVS